MSGLGFPQRAPLSGSRRTDVVAFADLGLTLIPDSSINQDRANEGVYFQAVTTNHYSGISSSQTSSAKDQESSPILNTPAFISSLRTTLSSKQSSYWPPELPADPAPPQLSNLRPVYYAPLFPELHSSPKRPTTLHPYSLAEFPSHSASAQSLKQLRLHALKQELHAADLAWRLHQYRVDAFNQAFWVRTNTAFLRAKERWVDKHAASLPANTREEDLDLSGFYKEHLERTKREYAEYNAQLWRLQASLVWPAVKAAARGWRWKWELWKAGGAGAGA